MNTLSEVYNNLKKTLCDFFSQEEANVLSFRILDICFGLKKNDLILNPNLLIDEEKYLFIQNVVLRLKNNEPIEYILNSAQFLDLDLFTERSVLIPRPETEELALLVLDYLKQKNISLNVLDIGTGSGCISIYLATKYSLAKYYALDISEKAITTAKKNVLRHGVDVNVIKGDILDLKNVSCWNPIKKYDVIVSNPPYVTQSERFFMKANVLDYEPNLALFVPDNNPLIFYKSIVNFAKLHLADHGAMFFEINENFGNETLELLENEGFVNVEIKNDLFGKNRFVVVKC